MPLCAIFQHRIASLIKHSARWREMKMKNERRKWRKTNGKTIRRKKAKKAKEEEVGEWKVRRNRRCIGVPRGGVFRVPLSKSGGGLSRSTGYLAHLLPALSVHCLAHSAHTP